MAWELKEEWIDLAEAKHVVIFHNRDVLVDYGYGKPEPVQHLLINQFKLTACPHCGQTKTAADGVVDDFAQTKSDTLAALKTHHNMMMQYREKHPQVRLGSGPKK